MGANVSSGAIESPRAECEKTDGADGEMPRLRRSGQVLRTSVAPSASFCSLTSTSFSPFPLASLRSPPLSFSPSPCPPTPPLPATLVRSYVSLVPCSGLIYTVCRLSPSVPLSHPKRQRLTHSSCAREHQRCWGHHWEGRQKRRRTPGTDRRLGWRQQSHPRRSRAGSDCDWLRGGCGKGTHGFFGSCF